VSEGDKDYFGKYRGTVLNNVDPEQRGRILAQVPDVSALLPTSWALPCVPIAGRQMGMYAVPQIGSAVWIEFEQGDPNYPIWTGCWWGSAAEVPSTALATPAPVPHILLQTMLMNLLQVSDLPGPTGGIALKSATGAMILVNDVGITISNGKGAVITLIGNIVDINGGALTVL
jgi:hypothetical protein